MNALALFEFESATVSVLEIDNELAFLVPQVEAALGYVEFGLANRLRDWSNEIIPGIDRIEPTPEILSGLKAAGLIGARASTVGILTESGLNLVLMKTEKPAGVVLRGKLAREILPALRKTGAYLGGHGSVFAAARAALPAELVNAPAGAALELLASEESARQALPSLRACLAGTAKVEPLPVAPPEFEQPFVELLAAWYAVYGARALKIKEALAGAVRADTPARRRLRAAVERLVGTSHAAIRIGNVFASSAGDWWSGYRVVRVRSGGGGVLVWNVESRPALPCA